MTAGPDSADLGPRAKVALVEVRARFVARLDERLEEIGQAAVPVLRSARDVDVRSPVQELQGLAHKLAGTAGMFGFHALSDSSRSLETICEEVASAGGKLTKESLMAIKTAVDVLEQSAQLTKREYKVSAG